MCSIALNFGNSVAQSQFGVAHASMMVGAGLWGGGTGLGDCGYELTKTGAQPEVDHPVVHGTSANDPRARHELDTVISDVFKNPIWR